MPKQRLIQEIVNDNTAEVESLSGGDMNAVYKVTCKNRTVVVKLNDKNRFPSMFKKEANGLAALRNTETVTIPSTYKVSEIESYQYLVLDYIAAGQTSPLFWRTFGQQLAKLHQHSATHFGFDEDNYIGSLPQSNTKHNNWTDFVITERFMPMVAKAVDDTTISTAEAKQIEAIYMHCNELWPSEPAALIHGDLWSGNFLVDSTHNPVLIDPATYYGHREMDIGMMHLFGGFDDELFEAYHATFPLAAGWKKRLKYNKLYPLLVHLNLFGRSYLSSVLTITRPF